MSLQEKIENLETDLHLMGRLVLDALVDGVRACLLYTSDAADE